MTEDLNWPTFSKHVGEFLGLDSEVVRPETHIYNDLGLDSLGMFSLGMHLIKRFGIRLPLSEVATIATLDDIYQALARYQGKAV
ncbi:MAG TPA: acyl carrier protein [Polyangiaceae bacterium]|nr:acyl carrier protein [Polyangiaceae bacterium]